MMLWRSSRLVLFSTSKTTTKTMIIKTNALILLATLIWRVHSQDDTPVNLLDLKDVIIENYHGAMDDSTMVLFENIETLSFESCNFTSFNENFLHPLKNLEKIVYANCHFDRVKEDVWRCCEKLRTIEVINSSVGTVTEVELKKAATLAKLERLYLFRIDLPALRGNTLAGSNLKTLEIERGNLATIEDGAFSGMDKLEVLSLKYNKLKTFPTGTLASLKNLKKLDLSGNLLEKVKGEDFPSMPNLEKMNLGHNPIKEIDLKGLKEKMPKLKEVDVSGIDIDISKNDGVPLVQRRIL